MQTFAAGTTVTLTIPLVDLNGNPVEPTAISYEVQDQDGVILVPVTTLLSFTPGDTEAEVMVPNVKNLVTGVMGARTVYLDMVLPNGDTAGLETTYLLKGAVRLTVPVNSFQTYTQALVEAATMPDITGWATADETARSNALEEAYRRLTRLGFTVRSPEDFDDMDRYVVLDEDRIDPMLWPIMTLSYFQDLPAHFRKALARAQIQEANAILSGDIVSDKRRQGLLSESIGESSMMFRSGKALEMGIDTRTREHLTGFINYRLTVTRT